MTRYAIVGLLILGCGTTSVTRFDDGGKGEGGGSDASDPHGDASFSTDAAAADDCSDAAKLVYLFTDSANLYSFDPPNKKLTSLGQLSCPSSSSPNSMAVARDGSAYVNYADGSIFKVDIKSLSCSSTAFKASGWTTMGMGFSTNGTASKDETLYVAKIVSTLGSSSELARVVLPTMKLETINTFSSTAFGGLSPELTGTGDGRLYGFFVDFVLGSAAKLAEVDKTNASALSNVTLSQITSVGAWAFSFWGGDFYLYYASGVASSKVGRYRPSDKTFVDYMTTNVRIVGAGVSTCAPVTPR